MPEAKVCVIPTDQVLKKGNVYWVEPVPPHGPERWLAEAVGLSPTCYVCGDLFLEENDCHYVRVITIPNENCFCHKRFADYLGPEIEKEELANAPNNPRTPVRASHR